MMSRKILLLTIILTLCICGCGNDKINSYKSNVSKKENVESVKNNNDENVSKIDKSKTLNIVTSNRFMYYCVKNIEMQKHKVDYIFYNTPNQLNIKYYYYDIKTAPDLFIYDEYNLIKYSNSYIDKINSNKVGIINSTRGINTISKYNNVTLLGKQDNSYYWNNIDNIKIVLLNIKNSIIDRDPMNRKYYEDNFNAKLKQLHDYDESFSRSFDKLKDYTFIVQGNYLQYFIGYSGLNTLIINDDELSTHYKAVDNFIENKCIDKDKIIMLYCDNNFINAYKALINKYDIKAFRYKPLSQEGNYESIFEYEGKVLNYLAKNCILPSK